MRRPLPRRAALDVLRSRQAQTAGTGLACRRDVIGRVPYRYLCHSSPLQMGVPQGQSRDPQRRCIDSAVITRPNPRPARRACWWRAGRGFERRTRCYRLPSWLPTRCVRTKTWPLICGNPVRQAGFEPATRCLEGTVEASLHVARCGSTSHLTGLIKLTVAWRRLVTVTVGSQFGSQFGPIISLFERRKHHRPQGGLWADAPPGELSGFRAVLLGVRGVVMRPQPSTRAPTRAHTGAPRAPGAQR
jgi:hypothetical protein